MIDNFQILFHGIHRSLEFGSYSVDLRLNLAFQQESH